MSRKSKKVNILSMLTWLWKQPSKILALTKSVKLKNKRTSRNEVMCELYRTNSIRQSPFLSIWGPLWAAPIKWPFSVSVVDNPGMTSEQSDAWHGCLHSFCFPLPAGLHVQLSIRSYFILMEFGNICLSTVVCFSSVEGWAGFSWGYGALLPS